MDDIGNDTARASASPRMRAETLGQLGGQIAHDFNNILAVALTSVEMAMRIGDPAKANVFLANALKVIARGRTLTDSLAAASHACEIPAAVDVNEILARLGAADAALSIELRATRSVVRSDPRFLEQTLTNLIENARDASPARLAPKITTRNASGADIRAEHGRDYLVIDVSDTGEGMSDETRHQAFELFFSRRVAEANRGVGLAQAKDTARRAGGIVSIESRAGEGTTVTLALPLEETA
ncbi:MAG: HAMP domain-containing sensor histidine kinase [Rhodanobacteraceae bacterium]